MLAADVPLGVLHSTWSCGVLLCNGWRHEKNSDMNISLILRTVDIAHQILEQRGVAPPHHLAVQADNTCREQRNQFVFSFLAVATGRRLWASVSPVFYIPGHSHNEVDQRFVPVAASLSRSPQLQTCEDPC